MHLVLAGEPQKHERDRLTWQAWGQRLTLDAFLAREVRLRSHPWAKERMQTWLWCDGDAVLASCETFRMDSRRAGAGWGSTYAFASVFTEPALRGRGHATAMMNAVVAGLRALDSKTDAAILFSDVGAPIYERGGGFRAREAFDRVWPSEAGDPAAEVDALITEDQLEAELRDAVAPPDEPFIVWPSAGQIDWHLERERAYANLLRRLRPEACGARAGRSRIFWAGDLKNSRLVVLLLDAQRIEEAVVLVRAAQRVAARAGLLEVRGWHTPRCPEWSRLADGGRLCARADSLPMIAPLAPGLSPEAWRFVPRALWV